jgi:hypothetical protein
VFLNDGVMYAVRNNLVVAILGSVMQWIPSWVRYFVIIVS